ncbi:hypothetical protein ACLH0K_10685 [Arthrobacter sp. MPF02]|uniref:sunset domain-containing protein n=1 Tax=Arthrobacter sp. MPF02 TaxID=3388492 RepID=UPI003984D613
MDTVFWVILIIVVVGIIWWLLNRNSSSGARPETKPADAARADGALSPGSADASADTAATAGISGAAGFGRPAEPPAPTTAEEPAEASASTGASGQERKGSGATAVAGMAGHAAGGTRGTAGEGSHDERRQQDQAGWETQWSEAGGGVPVGTTNHAPATPVAPEAAAKQQQPQSGDNRPAHHPEYTGAHAPTLPGAETAALEDANDDGTPITAKGTSAAGHSASGAPVGEAAPSGAASQGTAGGPAVPAGVAAAELHDRTQSSALVEEGADHTEQDRPGGASGADGLAPEPGSHLAAQEPYGMGSAPPAADGSGPAGYGVKGDAGAMVYYEEGHPDYGQTRADVWFESAAHAEAAGFRAPRRRRL